MPGPQGGPGPFWAPHCPLPCWRSCAATELINPRNHSRLQSELFTVPSALPGDGLMHCCCHFIAVLLPWCNLLGFMCLHCPVRSAQAHQAIIPRQRAPVNWSMRMCRERASDRERERERETKSKTRFIQTQMGHYTSEQMKASLVNLSASWWTSHSLLLFYTLTTWGQHHSGSPQLQPDAPPLQIMLSQNIYKTPPYKYVPRPRINLEERTFPRICSDNALLDFLSLP